MPSWFRIRFLGFDRVVNTNNLSITIKTIVCLRICIHDIRFEKVGNFPDIITLKFFSINISLELKIKIKKILSSIILIHTNIFKLKLDLNIIIG